MLVDYLTCHCNQLTSLEYCPESVTLLNCGNNQLTSLQYCPKNIKTLICDNNQLRSLQDCPINLLKLDYRHNPVQLEYLNKSLDEIKLINYTKRMKQGLQIVDKLIFNRKASMIQRCWDNYWYRPNEQGISRHALNGYINYGNRDFNVDS